MPPDCRWAPSPQPSAGDSGRLMQGFRSFQLYLIVYVIWSGLSLIGQLSPFMGGGS